MTIPFMPNVGFTEVSSAGSLNDKAGTKTKLPIQFFRLTDNISGNLSLSDDSITFNNQLKHYIGVKR